MTDPTRIAVTGAAGWAGRRHVEAFRTLGGRIVALVDPSPHVQSVASVVGAEVFDSPARLQPDEVDLVVVSLFPGVVSVHSTHHSAQLHRASVADYTAATLTFGAGPVFRLETYRNPRVHTTGLNQNDWSLEVDVIAHEGRRVWSNWSLHAWDRLGSETVHHFPQVDLFVEQAKKALRSAGGDQPVVGYRQALRATEIADEILSKGRERV